MTTTIAMLVVGSDLKKKKKSLIKSSVSRNIKTVVNFVGLKYTQSCLFVIIYGIFKWLLMIDSTAYSVLKMSSSTWKFNFQNKEKKECLWKECHCPLLFDSVPSHLLDCSNLHKPRIRRGMYSKTSKIPNSIAFIWSISRSLCQTSNLLLILIFLWANHVRYY